jgi:hypothetical protein
MLRDLSYFPLPRKSPLRAELADHDRCSAAGISCRAYAPVLEICRKLIEAGHDPAAALHAYRGPTLCLIVRSIGEAADLEIGDDPPRFRRRGKPVGASPIAQNGPPLAEAAE